MAVATRYPDKPFAQEGYDLMGAAFEVHRYLGGGLLEEIYQQSLEIELSLRNIPCVSKKELLQRRVARHQIQAGSGCISTGHRRTEDGKLFDSRARSTVDQLHAHHSAAGGLSDQFRQAR